MIEFDKIMEGRKKESRVLKVEKKNRNKLSKKGSRGLKSGKKTLDREEGRGKKKEDESKLKIHVRGSQK